MLGALSSEFPFGATLVCLDVWCVLFLVLQWLCLFGWFGFVLVIGQCWGTQTTLRLGNLEYLAPERSFG